MSLSSELKLNSNHSSETLQSTSTLCAESEASDHPRHEKHCHLPEKDEGNVAPPDGKSINTDSSSSNIKSSEEGLSVDSEVDVVPDGGLRAWLVIVGITLCTFTAFGLASTWGVFQAYYESKVLRDASSTQIAWIGSVQYGLLFIPSMLVGRLFDKGYFHSLFITFSTILIVSTVLVAECTHFWQFFVCQGMLTGLSCGVITAPTPALLSQWFKRRRALAFGITACGSAFGGTVLPIVIRAMLPSIGFKWTVRAVALILLVCLTTAGLTMRRRLPPSHPTGPLLGVKPLKTPAFVVWCFATLFVYLGAYTFQAYVASTAGSKGFTENFSFTLVAVMNGSSGIGRISAGVIANYIGSMNHMIPATTLTAVVVLAWPSANTHLSLVFVSILYGFTAGSFAALLWHPILDLGEPDELSRRVGILMIFLGSAGLVGPPISGEVNGAAGIHVMSIYAGGCILFGVILASVARYMLLKKTWGKL